MMLSIVKSDGHVIKRTNQSVVLQTIKIFNQISRIDLAKETGLNPSTISRVVRDLKEYNLILETEEGESRGGRRPIFLEINREAYHILGIDVGATKIKGVVVNLVGEIKERVIYEIPYENEGIVSISPKRVLETIQRLLARYRSKSSTKRDAIVGIGVGVHGLVNSLEGISLFAPNFGWQDVPLKKKIEDEFHLRTLVDNDVRAMALGEYWFGKGQGVKNLICINVGYGIGAGIILDHSLYHGSNSRAGELGHTTVDEDGPLCNCGNYGCLERLASGPAIVKQVKSLLQLDHTSLVTHLVEDDLSKLTGEVVYQAAKRGDPLSCEVFHRTGGYLGIGIANLVNILDPDKILIGGGVAKASAFLFSRMEEVLKKRTIGPFHVMIEEVGLGEMAGAIGASVLILKEIFNDPTTILEGVS